jgi:hypothetical protein
VEVSQGLKVQNVYICPATFAWLTSTLKAEEELFLYSWFKA